MGVAALGRVPNGKMQLLFVLTRLIYLTSYIAYLVWDTNPGWEPRWGALGPMLVASWVIFATAF